MACKGGGFDSCTHLYSGYREVPNVGPPTLRMIYFSQILKWGTQLMIYFLCRELVGLKVLRLVPLRTHLMFADALTKSLPSPAHIKHRDVMLGRVPFAARSLRSFGG